MTRIIKWLLIGYLAVGLLMLNSVVRCNRLAGSHQSIQARVTGHVRAPAKSTSLGSVRYGFEVQGRSYKGSFASGPMEPGTPVKVYYCPEDPGINSANDLADDQENAKGRLIGLLLSFPVALVVVVAVHKNL